MFATEDHVTTCRKGGTELLKSVYAWGKNRSIREKLRTGAASRPSSFAKEQQDHVRGSGEPSDTMTMGLSVLIHSRSRRTHHAHDEAYPTPDMRLTPGPDLPHQRPIIPGSTAGRHERSVISPQRERRHLLGCSWQHAPHHSGNGTAVPRHQCALRCLVGRTHALWNHATAESAHARTAPPAFSQSNGQSATPATDRLRVSGPDRAARWTTRPLTLPTEPHRHAEGPGKPFSQWPVESL